jgi:hypothetical protein
MSQISQQGFLHDLAESAGILSNSQPGTLALSPKLFPAKSRNSIIGTVASGKSTIVAGMGITAESLVRLSETTNHKFYCQILEGSGQIHQDKANLRAGHFPKKTQAFTGGASEAGFYLEWETKMPWLTSSKYLQNPICDLAGEDIQQTIRQVVQQKNIGDIAKQKIADLIGYMRESDVFTICLKGTRAEGFSRKLEKEKDTYLSEDPDVNMVRLLQDLIYYKMNNMSRAIKGMAIIITAADVLQRELGEELGFNICKHFDPRTNPREFNQQQTDLLDFVSSAFPATYAAIRSLKVPNVIFLPSYFELELDVNNNVKYWPEEPDSPKIAIRKINPMSDDWRLKLRKPCYSESFYYDYFDWLHNFAGA